ncbi:MAG: alpha/beta hydrolase [Microthrixaceae bacterium]
MSLSGQRAGRARRWAASLALVAAASSCATGLGQAAEGPATTRASDRTTTTGASNRTTTTAGDSTTTTAPDDDPLGGFQPDPPSWSDCGRGAECATLAVPLDWEDPDGDTIDLALSRDPASGDRAGAVLVNPGGPGGSGTDMVGGVFVGPRFDDLTQRFDVVGWDPRGTNDSEPISCDDNVDELQALDPSPDDAAEQAALEDAAAEVAADCERQAGDRLAHVSTHETVLDMEAIRRALGDEQLTYYGFSYGTALGSFYADEFPDRVRAIVLDGVVDPDADLEEFLVAQTRGFEDSLDAMFEACGSSCPTGGADALYDRLAAQVERKPLGAGDRTLGPAELAVAAISATYTPDSGPRFIAAMEDADDGDPDALLGIADDYYSAVDFTPYLAIECIDQPHPEGFEAWQAFVTRLEEVSPRLGGSIGNELLPCADWPVDVQRTPTFPTATGSDAILVIGNTGDAATPFAQAETMAERLDNAVLVTHEGTGHTSYGNPCVDEITAAYLVDLKLPDEGTTCSD